MQGYTDPATMTNMAQASHVDPQSGTMKTVSEFLTSPQPIVPMNEAYAPYPHMMVGGSPYPQTPHMQLEQYNRSDLPTMSLRTLWNRTFGSASK